VIVKRLAAIHDFGAMSVLCTDKTGTLTTASITLVAHPDTTGNDNPDVRLLAAINSRFESGVKSPFDSAILASCDPVSLQPYTKLAELPFDFERRSVSILASVDGAPLLITKGAPEAVLEKTTHYQRVDGAIAELDPVNRAKIQSVHDRFAKDGNRLLAIATKTMPAGRESIDLIDEQALVFRGFCVFIDPPKESAAAAIERLIGYGIKIKVLSGDHDLVVRHVAEKLRIPFGGTITGTQIDELSDAALAIAVRENDLFSRISPDQKTRIVRALQANQETVGFIGDGVNDAPAIRNADVGISVEAATDVARAAADFIMLDRDLTVLADGVEEGRKTFVNIVKYIRMGTSSNFGNMLSMALSSLFIPFLPLLPIQILLNNLIYDFSEIGIPFDRVGAAEIQKPQRWNFQKIVRFTFVMGSLSSCFDILTFVLLLKFFAAPPELFRTAWFIESMATQILVIFFIRSAASISDPPARILVLTSILALAAALFISLSPAAFIFGFTAVPAALLAAIAGIVAAYLLAVALMKIIAKNFLFSETGNSP
jgi:Mg2+-importing ATPase